MKRTGLKKYEYADVEHFTSKAGLRFRKIINKSWHIFSNSEQQERYILLITHNYKKGTQIV